MIYTIAHPSVVLSLISLFIIVEGEKRRMGNSSSQKGEHVVRTSSLPCFLHVHIRSATGFCIHHGPDQVSALTEDV